VHPRLGLKLQVKGCAKGIQRYISTKGASKDKPMNKPIGKDLQHITQCSSLLIDLIYMGGSRSKTEEIKITQYRPV
jgi:hypothetical protein